MNTIYKGIIVAVSQFAVFLIFFYADLLPEGRFILFGITLLVGVVAMFGVLKDYFLTASTGFLKQALRVYIILCVSSLFSILLDTTFNTQVEPDYKFILAQERVEAINKRREAKGVGVYESLDRTKIEEKYTLEASLENFGVSCAFNILGSLFISGIGILYRKSQNAE